MGEIVNFGSYKAEDILFSGEILENDNYLQLTTMNLLNKFGYTYDKNSIIDLQKSLGIAPTGVISDEEFLALVDMLEDPDDKNHILGYYNEIKTSIVKEEKENKRSMNFLILWLLGICFFAIWGFIDFIKFIINLIIK